MPEMQRQEQPVGKPQDEWQQDLNPNPEAGQNDGEGALLEVEFPTAYDIKELHQHLQDYSDDDLKQIKVLPNGTRLRQGATYIDLMNSERQEFTAIGNMEAGSSNCYVRKTQVSYELWNRLTGVDNPERLNSFTQE